MAIQTCRLPHGAQGAYRFSATQITELAKQGVPLFVQTGQGVESHCGCHS
jgi:hypothetical protein